MTSDHLVQLVSAYSAHSDRSEATISNLCVGHARLFSRLREGQSCTIRTASAVIQWFSDHWPDSLPWPEDIPRPMPARPAEARP
jgi:hypothetical protein